MRLLFVTTPDRLPAAELLDLLGAQAQVDTFALPDAEPGASGAAAIAQTLVAVEAAAESHSPDAALIDLAGDAALAAALVFSKLPIPVARLAVEPGQDAALADLLCEAVLPDSQAALSWLTG
jgi:hypothetical protein